MPNLFAAYAWLPDGWTPNVQIDIDPTGLITAVTPNARPQPATALTGAVLPGIPNLHSHAFQWAMAGLTERAGLQTDSFWTWRQVMYRFLQQLTPEQIEIIATYLYIEMLKAGFTSVGEFHYLHHDAEGRSYAQPAELSLRLMAAAQTAGIGLTLLPVLYAYSNFGAQPPSPAQQRFVTSVDRFIEIWLELDRVSRHQPQVRLGVAPHSLRAVTPTLMQEVLAVVDAHDPTAPIHLHIAEQQREVDDCLSWSGLRPVEWAQAHLPLSSRWCLVHATHMTPNETARLAEQGVVVGLCPTTEANLGDGIFPALDYLRQSGRFGIGSDSNISVSPIEELRWLEYGQRLVHQRRGLLAAANGSVGELLYRRAVAGGAQALGQPIGQLQPGYRADLLVLDLEQPAFLQTPIEQWLDQLIFVGNRNPIRDVMVAGTWVVQAQQHPLEPAVKAKYRQVCEQLRR